MTEKLLSALYSGLGTLPGTHFIKTVMRLLTVASNYSQLWLGMQLLLGFLACSLVFYAPLAMVAIAFKLTVSHEDLEGLVID